MQDKQNKLLNGDSVKKNFIFQFVYQVVILVIPLVISPYLTRVLGSKALGIYTYTYSIAYYFVIVAMLGISKYGQRIVAERKKDILKLRQTVWSLVSLHLVVSILVFVAYVGYALLLCKSDKNVVLAQGIYVFSAIIDFTWLFQGLERFKTVVVRNTIVKIIECSCIFAFVKSPDDIVVYTIIMSVSVCIGYVAVLPQIFAAIKPIRFSLAELFEHFKPMLVLFVAAIAATVYTVFDKTLLGLLSDVSNVAFYEYSNKIITIPRTFIVVISTVLFPKACNMASEKNYDGMNRILKQSLMINYFIGCASIFGLLAVSNMFATLYYGVEFEICGKIICMMSPLILIIGLGETLRSQYIYPLKKDKKMVLILFCNAAVNLFLSTLLIPKIGVYGAVIGTCAAELLGLIFELAICRQYVSLKTFWGTGIPFVGIGIVMYCSIKAISTRVSQNILGLFTEIIVGASVYLICSFIYCYFANKETRYFLKEIQRKISEKLVKK